MNYEKEIDIYQQFVDNRNLYTSTRYWKNGYVHGGVIAISGSNPCINKINEMIEGFLTFGTAKWVAIHTNDHAAIFNISDLDIGQLTININDLIKNSNDLESHLKSWWDKN